MKSALLNYVKKNRFYLAVMTICAIAFFALMYQVVLYADDYSVGVLAHEGVFAIIQDIGRHYMRWGGGYTPTIVCFLLLLGPVIWKVGVVLQGAIIIALTSRMISREDSKKRGIVALLMWILLFCTSVTLLRETILWLDGSVAYLFTTMQITLVFYFLYTRLFQGDSKKYDLFLIPFVCFFGGWSSPQSGSVAVLVALFLVLYCRIIKKEKVKILYWASLVLTIIGFAVYYFAPGNYARMSTFEYYSNLSFPQKILYRVSDVYLYLFDGNHFGSPTVSSFFVVFALAAIALLAFYKSKNIKNKKVKKLSLVCSGLVGLYVLGYVVSFLEIPQLGSFAYALFHFSNLQTSGNHGVKFLVTTVPYFVATIAIIASVINSWILAKTSERRPFIITTLLAALATDYVMIFAPYSPTRIILYTVIFSWVIITDVVFELIGSKERIMPLAIMMLACISINLSLLFAIIYIAAICWAKLKDDKKYALDIAVLMVCLGIFAFGNYATMFVNYRANRYINEANMAQIEAFKSSENDCGRGEEAKNCVIVFARFKDGSYAWDPLVGEDWIEDSVRAYFKLPENVQLTYEEE